MKINYRIYCEIPTEVITKPKCLRYNKLILETGNKIKTVWRTETGNRRIFHRRKNKQLMMYANIIRNLKKTTAFGFSTS